MWASFAGRVSLSPYGPLAVTQACVHASPLQALRPGGKGLVWWTPSGLPPPEQGQVFCEGRASPAGPQADGAGEQGHEPARGWGALPGRRQRASQQRGTLRRDPALNAGSSHPPGLELCLHPSPLAASGEEALPGPGRGLSSATLLAWPAAWGTTTGRGTPDLAGGVGRVRFSPSLKQVCTVPGQPQATRDTAAWASPNPSPARMCPRSPRMSP